VAQDVAGYARKTRRSSVTDRPKPEPVSSGHGRVSFAGPPDDDQVLRIFKPACGLPCRPTISLKRPEKRRSRSVKRRQHSHIVGSEPSRARAPSIGECGCQDGQKTARGRHFPRPPFAGSQDGGPGSGSGQITSSRVHSPVWRGLSQSLPSCGSRGARAPACWIGPAPRQSKRTAGGRPCLPTLARAPAR
jgi:hypothetical protein